MANEPATTRADTATARTPLRMGPPGEVTRLDGLALQDPGRQEFVAERYRTLRRFRNAKSADSSRNLPCVLLDGHAVVHLVDAKDLRLAAIGAQLVVFAHDERLDRLGWADFRAQATEAAPREVE